MSRHGGNLRESARDAGLRRASGNGAGEAPSRRGSRAVLRGLPDRRARRGWSPKGGVSARYDIEPALDRLAQAVRESLDMERISRLMRLR